MEPPVHYTAPPVYAGPAQADPSQVYTFFINVKPGRVKGRVSEFREGAMYLNAGGITLDGRAVLPQWQSVLLLIFPGILVGIVIMAVILEYAVRLKKTVTLGWSDVADVVLDSRKQRACLVFHDPAAPAKLVSLAFQPDAGRFGELAQVLNHFAPGKVREGKIGSPGGPAVWILLAIVLLFFAFVVIMAATGK